MSSRQPIQPLQTQSKPLLQPPKNIPQSSTSAPTRQPPMTARAGGKPSSSSQGRITNSSPNTNPSFAQKMGTQRGQQLNSTSGSGPLSAEKEPFDKEIKNILKRFPQPDGADGYLHNLRAAICACARLALDPETEIFSDQGDLYIKQLARVLDELKKSGQCRIGDEIIRP